MIAEYTYMKKKFLESINRMYVYLFIQCFVCFVLFFVLNIFTVVYVGIFKRKQKKVFFFFSVSINNQFRKLIKVRCILFVIWGSVNCHWVIINWIHIFTHSIITVARILLFANYCLQTIRFLLLLFKVVIWFSSLKNGH